MKGRELCRTIAKVVLVGCATLWLWQIVSISMEKSEMKLYEHQVSIAKEDLTSHTHKMSMLEAEVKEKNSWPSALGGFCESFMNGLTFGVFDKDGYNGPVRRLERWESSVRDRAAEYQTGIDNATAAIEKGTSKYMEASSSLRRKADARNVSGAFAIVAILVLVFVPSNKTNIS